MNPEWDETHDFLVARHVLVAKNTASTVERVKAKVTLTMNCRPLKCRLPIVFAALARSS